MVETMPGTFPSETLDRSACEREKDESRKLSLRKSERLFEEDCLWTLHWLVLLELLVVYWTDRSFLKLAVKAMVEYFVYQYHPSEQRQLLMIVVGNLSTTQGNNLDLDAQLRVWRRLLLLQMLVINLLAIVDHAFNYQPARLGPALLGWHWDQIVEYISRDCSYRVEQYSEHGNFAFGPVFINFVGELKSCSRLGLVLVDATVPLLQYIIYRRAVETDGDGQAPEEEQVADVADPQPAGNESHNESNRSQNASSVPRPFSDDPENPSDPRPKPGFEDGYQGNVTAFRVDVYPSLRINSIVHAV